MTDSPRSEPELNAPPIPPHKRFLIKKLRLNFGADAEGPSARVCSWSNNGVRRPEQRGESSPWESKDYASFVDLMRRARRKRMA